MNKYILVVLFFVLFSCQAIVAVIVEQGAWKLDISDSNGAANISKNGVLLIANSAAVFKLDDMRFPCTSLIFAGIDVQENYSDIFGEGKRIDIQYNNATPAFQAIHSYFLYAHGHYILTELKVTSNDLLASNYMSPVNTSNTTAFLPDVAGENVTLAVPFDNDAWVRYASNIFTDNTYTSYEVGCLFNKSNRNGLVMGSVEHDRWKTGVVYQVNTNNQMNSLEIFGGIATNAAGTAPSTRDLLPHGKVKGTMIKSPKIFVGYFGDWRTGMETYADVNAMVTPKLEWKSGVPFGWNSWGNAHMNLSYPIADGVSKFFADSLQAAFFNDGTVYMSLDAFWDNMTYQNRRRLVADIHERGQKAGIYWTPFSDWSGNENRMVEGTNNQYTYGDIHLKVNGAKRMLNNGYALDPTHPGTKMRNEYYVDQFIRDGYEYYKIDFMSHGCQEADSWYDPEVTTGIQAYNEGFDHLVKYIDGRMFLNLGIAPLFPSQYAHTRHICCENYGAMADTEYQLNALAHGWWLDRVYFCNNPDIMVFGIFTNNNPYPGTYSKHPVNVNRVRMTSVVTTGMTMFGDDFTNCTDLTRKTAVEFAKKTEITKLGKTGKSFRPVEGGWGDRPADLYMQWIGDTLYLAAYHFSSVPSQKKFTVDYSRVNLPAGQSYVMHELWMDTKTVIPATQTELTFTVTRTDARILKIYPAADTSDDMIQNNRVRIFPNPCSDYLYIDSKMPLIFSGYEIYTLQGKKIWQLEDLSLGKINTRILSPGIYFLILQGTEKQEVLKFIKQ